MPKQSSIFTAADELAQVLGEELARAFIDHRKALKKPMTAYAGQLMARKLRAMPNAAAAVEQSIIKGWTDVYPIEDNRQQYQRRKTAAEITGENLRREIADLYQGESDGKENGDLFPAAGLLAASRQTH